MNMRKIHTNRTTAERELATVNTAQLYWKGAQIWEVTRINLPGMCLGGAKSFLSHRPIGIEA